VDYATLFETVKGYVENDFPNTSWTDSTGSGTVTLTSKEQLDVFIRQAEQRIYNTVQLLALRKSSTGLTTTAGDPTLDTPADWLANFSLAVVDGDGNYVFLLNKDVNFIREAFPSPNDMGVPAYYAYSNEGSYLLGPTPDDAYVVELNYFYYPESIVTAGTSWLGDNFDSALLYGALLEAYTFMKGEADVMAVYRSRYEEALGLLKQLSDGKNRQDMYRTPQVRYPVK
jgi:hypothetical protein